MAGNQREIQRRERRAQKDKRNKKIIWIIIAVIIIILAIMKICEINVNSIKERFTDSNGSFTLTSEVVDDNFPYNIDSSQTLAFKDVNSKLAVLTPNSLSVINSKTAKTEYSFDHGYSNPILESSGAYMLVYDQGANSIRLDTTSDNIYENTTENTIHCAAVAKNGTVAYATTSNEKKSTVLVMNKALKQELSYEVSYGYVVAIAINDSGSKIAFACVNSENAQLKFKLYTMNIGTDDVKAEIDLPAGNLIDLEYSSNNLFVVGDNYLGVVSNQKKYSSVYDAGKINTISYNFTPSKDLILIYNNYSNSTDNTIVRVKSNAKVRKEGKVTGTVKSVSSSSSIVSILTNNSIVSYNISNLQENGVSTVDDSVKAICQMGSQVYVHRQSLIDRNEADN